MGMTTASVYGRQPNKQIKQQASNAVLELRKHAKESVDKDGTVHVEPQVLLDYATLIEQLVHG